MRFPGFIGPSYTLQSVNVDCQRCVNLFPEINALGTGKEREVAALVPTPGLSLLNTLPTGPIRGLWCASNGTLFAAAGNAFYSIASDWSYTSIGSLNTSSGPVSIADNGLHVVLVDGTYGYSWTIATNTFNQIVDANFFPSVQVTFQDGYFLFNRTGTQQFFISGLNAITFDGLDIGTAEGSPDNLVGLSSSNQHVILFGTQSVEVYYDSGDAGFPFARIQGAVLNVGCSAAFSIAKVVGALYWLGGDANGTGIVYRMQGMQPQRISTSAIESVIRNLTSAQISAATAYTYQQGGHIFYCLNLPGTNSTWVFDASTEFWHERTFSGLFSLERHRGECQAVAYGKNVVGDYQNGNFYSLDPSNYTDNGTSISRIRAAPHFSQDMAFIRHSSFQLDMETGVGITGTGQGSDPKIMLRWSDDGGHTWSNEYWNDAGKIGKYKTRAKWRRLGMSRDRVYEVKITDPVKVVLIGAEIDVVGGAT
jgi:hypothetical protein